MPYPNKNRMLRVRLLTKTASLPVMATPGSAGYDLSADEDGVIPPGGRALVSTGAVIAVPGGTYGRIAPRSGLALRNGISVGAGVIDSDYRGEIKILLFNHDPSAEFVFQKGDRIAQLVLEKIETPPVIAVHDIDDTSRSVNGFGSTGI